MRKRSKTLSLLLILAIIFSTLPMTVLATDSKQTKAFLSDDSLSSWANEEVESAYDAGIIPSDILSNFKTAITRGEFCELITTMLGKSNLGTLNKSATTKFSDVSETNKYYNSIKTASSLGIIKGYTNGTFLPNQTITRQEAATMLERTAKLFSIKSGTEKTFADSASIASWAKEGVTFVSSLIDGITGNQIMEGVGSNNFDPSSTYTREQAIVSVLRLFNIIRYGAAELSYAITTTYTDVGCSSKYYKAVNWLAQQGIVTQENDSSGCFRPDDYITLDEYLAMLVSIYVAPDKYVSSNVTDGWSDVYVSTAASVGIIDEDRYLDMSIYIPNTIYHKLSFDNIEYRFIWALLDNIEVFDCYPIWCFDGSEPRAYNECYQKSIEYMINYCGWNSNCYSLETVAKRGDVALLLYNVAMEKDTVKEPVPSITKALTLTNDGSGSAYELREAEWGCYLAFETLPQKYLDLVNETGFKILLTYDYTTYYTTIGKEQELSNFSGITDSQTKTIGIATQWAWMAHMTLVHEIGHVVMQAAGDEAEPYLNYMLKKDGDALSSIFRSYCKSNEKEMFSEAFEFILRNRNNTEMYATMEEKIPYSLAVIEQAFLNADGICDVDTLAKIAYSYGYKD